MTSFNCEKYNHSLMLYLQLFFLQLCGHTRLCRVIVHFTASSLPDQTSVLPACLTEMKAQTLTDVLRTLAVLTSYIYVYLAFQHMDIHCRATVNQLPLCPGLQAKHLSPSSECPQGWKKKRKKKIPLHADFMPRLNRTNRDGTDPKTQPACRFSTRPCCGLPFVLSENSPLACSEIK